jgi:hypothetical protein
MSFFNKLFGSGVSGILDGASGIIDKFKLSPKDREQFKLEMESMLQRQESELEETYRKEVDAKMQIMTAELAQGDNYTKRARPTIVYVGLIFILMEILGLRHVFLSMIYDPKDPTYTNILSQSNDVFEYFLIAWSSVVGVYGIGRSVEKTGVRNKVTSIITGSGAFKADVQSKNIVG